MLLLNLITKRDVSGKGLKEAWIKKHKTPTIHGTFYTSMRRLKEEGWVEAHKNGKDGREAFYSLTTSGAKNLRIAKAAHALRDELKGKA